MQIIVWIIVLSRRHGIFMFKRVLKLRGGVGLIHLVILCVISIIPVKLGSLIVCIIIVVFVRGLGSLPPCPLG